MALVLMSPAHFPFNNREDTVDEPVPLAEWPLEWWKALEPELYEIEERVMPSSEEELGEDF